MTGILCISLDFELHWGGFDKWPLQVSEDKSRNPPAGDYRTYFLNTRKAIPQMLELFRDYEIHVTWAAVGFLLNATRSQLLENSPDLKPTYKSMGLSPYQYIRETGIGDNEESDPFHYAPTLVRRVLATPHQELGTHTYAHYYCNEEGQTVDQFKGDLQSAKRVTESYGLKLNSLVFPRNQFNEDYLTACGELGIKVVRTNPLDWFWHIESTQSESLWKRLNRGFDAYFPIGRKNTYSLDQLDVREGQPLRLPASRLLRPYRPEEGILNRFKINRVRSEMQQAAKNGEVYHLWWHPHNFGNYPEQSLAGLRRILEHYQVCRKKYGMISLNMGETAELVMNQYGKNKAA